MVKHLSQVKLERNRLVVPAIKYANRAENDLFVFMNIPGFESCGSLLFTFVMHGKACTGDLPQGPSSMRYVER